jgi:hypothetical protein
MATTKPRKQDIFKNILLAVVILLVAAQGVSWYCLHKANEKSEDAQVSAQTALRELDSATQQQALTPLPRANRLYLAELNLTVPLNPITSAVRYTVNSVQSSDDNEVRLTSAYMTDHTVHVKSCSDMVRLKVEAKPNPYSPEQPLYATVQLVDGRVLQVYASTTKECQVAWQAVSPQTIAEVFKSALSY